MTVSEFLNSLDQPTPPETATPHVKALWQEKRGDWDAAHKIVQDINDATASWIHAYLHRREGDESNAAYWYGQADRQFPAEALDDEWQTIVETLLA